MSPHDHLPPARHVGRRALRRQPDAAVQPELGVLDVDPLDLFGRGDDALVEGEAEGQVHEVIGRRHHHGMGRAVH